jgi:hypothetical protein
LEPKEVEVLNVLNMNWILFDMIILKIIIIIKPMHKIWFEKNINLAKSNKKINILLLNIYYFIKNADFF